MARPVEPLVARASGLALGLLLLGAGGCATRPATQVAVPTRLGGAEWVFEVRAARAPARLPADADDAVLLNTAASVIAHDLKLPFPDAVVAVAYRDEASFAEGLVRRGLGPEPASETARISVAIAVRDQIFLRADLLARVSLASRVSLYAHELAHVAQHRLDPDKSAPAWMREGHAQWVAYRVVDLLELQSYSGLRDQQRRVIVASITPRDQFPPLSALETQAVWKQAANRLGWAPTYGQAFLAVDRLVERYTEARLREFLRGYQPLRVVASPGRRDPREWHAVFGIPYDRFVAEFREYLPTLR